MPNVQYTAYPSNLPKPLIEYSDDNKIPTFKVTQFAFGYRKIPNYVQGEIVTLNFVFNKDELQIWKDFWAINMMGGLRDMGANFKILENTDFKIFTPLDTYRVSVSSDSYPNYSVTLTCVWIS